MNITRPNYEKSVDKYGLLQHASLFHTVGLGFENLESKEMAARRNEFSGMI